MFIAMNRFKVAIGQESAFELVWESRDSHLNKMLGFEEFHLLRGPTLETYTLYSSHTLWSSKKHFESWTHSDAFRQAHKNAGNLGKLYLDHPQFEGFTVVQTLSTMARE